jgi:hypothetical protein
MDPPRSQSSDRFWANAGETFHLKVSGPQEFRVDRVLWGFNIDRDPSLNYGVDAFKVFPVTTGKGELDLVVEHSGYHVISVGSPGAATPTAYEISATVTRRPETTGIVSMSATNYRGCAVTQSGDVKCWGFVHIGGNLDQVPPVSARTGATLASMGANVPKLPLPSKAAEVSMAEIGQYTAGAVRLVDGSVYTWFEDGTPAPLTLDAPATQLEGGTCARLANDAIQCWTTDYDTHEVTVTAPLSWAGHTLRSFSAIRSDLCVLFDDDSYSCTKLKDPHAAAPVALVAPGEHALAIVAKDFERCILTSKALHCTNLNEWNDPAAPFSVVRNADLPAGEVGQALGSEIADFEVVMKDGAAFKLVNKAEDRAPADYHRLPMPAFESGVQALAIQNTMMNSYTCALLQGGRVKCAGGADIGQLGLGDIVDRDPGETDSLGDNLPALDLGQ